MPTKDDRTNTRSNKRSETDTEARSASAEPSLQNITPRSTKTSSIRASLRTQLVKKKDIQLQVSTSCDPHDSVTDSTSHGSDSEPRVLQVQINKQCRKGKKRKSIK